MALHARIPHIATTSLPAIHPVSTDKPWLWLAAGWSDFIKAPGISLAYGLVVMLAMQTIFQLLQVRGYFIHALALMAGFAIIGPLLAVGLYKISHRLEQHLPVSFSDTFRGQHRNSGSILGIGLVMMLIVLGWFLLATQLTAMAYGLEGNGVALRVATHDWESFALSIRWPMVLSFGLTGLVAVSVTYVMTVVSVPLLTDREEMDILTAIVISARAVRKNPAALVLWAVLIAAFTGIAVVPIFLGLILVFPLLAYASWHAYRDLIEH